MAEKEYYRPREIAKLRLIKNTAGASTEASIYDYVLKQIKIGNLKAVNHGTNPDKPYYTVSMAEIERFNNEREA